VLVDTPDLRELVGRAQQGDVTVLPRLKEFLDAHPQVWQELGDLALHAREALIRLVAGDNLLVGECVRRDLAALEAELAGPSPSPLERILVQRVVCAGCRPTRPTWRRPGWTGGTTRTGRTRSGVRMRPTAGS
jgi:hypothetical protein